MKKYLLALVIALFSTAAFAQKASESNEKSPVGGQGNAIVIEMEAQAKNVEDVLNKKFRELKGKSEKGFTAYKGQIFQPISPDMLDIYWRVEKKNDNQSKLIFFLSKGYDNYLTSQTNPNEVGNTKKMLDELISEVRKYELQLAIDAQTKVLEGEVKSQEKLVKENEDLVKEKAKLEEALAENKKNTENNVKAQEEQKKKVEAEKKVLEELQKKMGEVK